ncbi:MAG: hypothetical protein QW231_01350 [Candidatus Bathyarchaeia archaeon]
MSGIGRFVSSVCGKARHFNGTTWCEKTRMYLCLHCGTDHRLLNGDFWNWKTYYAIGCPDCGERHPALDRLEFQGEHPWQLHPKMLKKREGLSPEKELQKVYPTHVSAEEHPVTEEQIAEAWDKAVDKGERKYTKFGDLNRRYVIDPASLEYSAKSRDCKFWTPSAETDTSVDCSPKRAPK